MHDVFISYSSKNKNVADAICHYLEEKGIKCWYAPRDIQSGQSWASTIVKAIKSARVFILVFSDYSNSSDHVMREIAQASESECTIIPFRIDDCEMSDDMSYYLKSLHWLDALTPPLEENLLKLCDRIDAIIDPVTRPQNVPSSVSPEHKSYPDIPQRPTAKKRKKLTTVIAALLAVIVGVVAFCFAFSLFSDTKAQQIEFLDMTSFEGYRYPFYGTSMFSVDKNLYIIENTQSDDLSLVKTDTGHPVASGIDYEYKNNIMTYMLAKEDSDIIYFINSDEGSFQIYNWKNESFVTEESVELPLSDTEELLHATYNSSGLTYDANAVDDMACFVYDSDEAVNCYSKAFYIKSDASYTEHDISKYKLVEFAAGIDREDVNAVLMWDEKHTLKVLDVQNGKVLDLSYNEMKEEYLPYITDTMDSVSPDKKYISYTSHSNDKSYLNIWDLNSGKVILSEVFNSTTTPYFTSDNRMLCFNYDTYTLNSYDLLTGQSKELLGDDYFSDTKVFENVPYSFYYSDKLGYYFFSVSTYDEETDSIYDHLIITDTNGKVLYTSQAFEVPFDYYYFCRVEVEKDQIYYSLMPVLNEENSADKYMDSICTGVYRIMYTVDENTEVLFSTY